MDAIEGIDEIRKICNQYESGMLTKDEVVSKIIMLVFQKFEGEE